MALTRQQQLESKPLRLVDGDMADGRLTVRIQQKHWSRWLLQSPKDATKSFEFDALGQMVWSLCDGKTSVQQIARKLSNKYNVSERESLLATENFLIMLASKELIGAKVNAPESFEKGTIMATSTVEKICIACGSDVAQAKRIKIADGIYYCQSCWDKANAEQTASSVPRAQTKVRNFPASASHRRPHWLAALAIVIAVVASVSAIAIQRQSKRLNEENVELRSKLDAASAAAARRYETSPTQTTPQPSVQDMIDGDPIVSNLLDRYPEFGFKIHRGEYPDNEIGMMILTNKMTASDAQHIQQFCAQIRSRAR